MKPTRYQLRQLMTEASEHGDIAQVIICEQAIAGDQRAINICADVIEHAAWLAREAGEE